MGNRLEAKKTPLEFDEMARSMLGGWARIEGSSPSPETLAVLLAQSALETGHWKSLYCFNLGNAKASAKWAGDYCFYFADEYVSRARAAEARRLLAPRTDGVAGHDVEVREASDGRVQVLLWPDHPWCRFRAFQTLDAGVDEHLGLLKKKFGAAWSAARRGDPEAFVVELRGGGYFTGGLESYRTGVTRLFRQFLPKLERSAGLFPEIVLPQAVRGRPLLLPGARGAFVREVQTILLAAGYADVAIDGEFDEATRRAVVLFQMQHVDARGRPLKQDGRVGENTWWALLNPSGDAQRSRVAPPVTSGLTETRKKLVELLIAEHAKDVREQPDGSNDGEEIRKYWGKTGIRKKPWCCAFVSWGLGEVLGQPPIGGTYHLGVQRMWIEARELGMETFEPKPGDVFVQIKDRGTGHTGFVVSVSADGETIYTCEGNCGNRLKLGLRPRSSIHHFVDCLRDGQGNDFTRGSNLTFEDVSDEGTR